MPYKSKAIRRQMSSDACELCKSEIQYCQLLWLKGKCRSVGPPFLSLLSLNALMVIGDSCNQMSPYFKPEIDYWINFTLTSKRTSRKVVCAEYIDSSNDDVDCTFDMFCLSKYFTIPFNHAELSVFLLPSNREA